VAINHVVLTGTVAEPGPKMTYSASAKPETKLTLVVSDGKGDQVFNLYVPVFVYGTGAERAAEDVDTGDLIAVEGRLGWKSTLKKDGTKLGLCVTTFGVEVLVKAEGPDASTADLALTPESEQREDQPVKVRRRGYPRAALDGGFTQHQN
jgi:single-stranded DNA-binding protein